MALPAMPRLYYKFLTAENCLRVLETQSLKISRLTELNDVFDCSPILVAPPDEPDHTDDSFTQHVISQNSKNYGLLCFSKTLGSPLLWGHYSNCATGAALGFDPDGFSWKNPMTVRYDQLRPVFKWPAEKDITSEATADELLSSLFGVKAKEWAYEEEVRYILELEKCGLSGGLYTAHFPPKSLKQVVLGFRSKIDTTYVRHLLKKNYPGCDIEVLQAAPEEKRFAMSTRSSLT
jgi:hypothetical protein